MPECQTCGKEKKPIGRDAAARGPEFCDHECTGYLDDPHPGYDWPSEVYQHTSYVGQPPSHFDATFLK